MISMKKLKISLLVFLIGCGQSSSQNNETETPKQNKVLPPVTADTCSAQETFSFAPLTVARSLRPRDLTLPISGFNLSSWDGRLFFLTNHQPINNRLGWFVTAFRPERLTADERGYPRFTEDTLSQKVLWEDHGEPNARSQIVVYPNNDFKENPFRSNSDGQADRLGEFETYEVIVIAPFLADQNQKEMRKGQIIVGKPKTSEAYIAKAGWHSPFEELKTVSGKRIRGLEPTVTFDGHLLIFQGNVKNNGEIGQLIYSWNATAGSATGWSEPKSIPAMYHTDRNVVIGGLPFHERFPIAKQPLRDALGKIYEKTDIYNGAYPWISLDGTELFHTSFQAGCAEGNPNCPESRWNERALRGGFSVIGRWTNYVTRLIDGPANPDRFAANPIPTVRTLTAAIGTFGNMWQPFREVSNLPIPYGARRPLYSLIGNARNEYSEVSFEDAMDGHYVLVLRMNELIARERPFFWEKTSPDIKIFSKQTPDTSPYLNNGTLVNGAKFPQEYNGQDKNVGKSGQAIYFTDKGKVEVPNSESLNQFKQGLSVELWARRQVDISGDSENRFRNLIKKEKVFALVAEENGDVQASVTLKLVDGSVVTRSSGPVAQLNGWTHLALTYNPADGRLRVFINGILKRKVQFEAAPLQTNTSPVIIGPGELTKPLWTNPNEALFLIDDVKISNILRTQSEIKASSFVSVNENFVTSDQTLPLGLKKTDLKLPMSINQSAVQLGEKLFFDPVLSGAKNISCATCHKPELAFTDGLARGIGAAGTSLRRNTPTIFNRAFSTLQFWDGRSLSIEDQAIVPIENPAEMNLPISEAVARLQSNPEYVRDFQSAFGEGISASTIGRALASFQRNQFLGNSRVDRFENGDPSALTDKEIRGRRTFHTKGRCISCHTGSNYSDENFHNTGFLCTSDYGREEATERPKDRRLFKTPTLRGVAQTAPYLHDGSIKTLEEIVELYNLGGVVKENKDTEMRPLGLTPGERENLVLFLKAL
jgi:cytochrome c peroxidase